MRTLSTKDIEEFASRHRVIQGSVENFLDCVGQAGTEDGDLLSLYYDARLYGWDILTIEAIEAGIRFAYACEAASEGAQAIDKMIESPLPAAYYSIRPRQTDMI